jgi:hypothetical protein
MKSYRIHNQKLLQGRPDATRDGFLEKSPPGRRRQKAAKEKKHIPSLAAIAAITALAAKIKNIRSY